MSMDDRSRGRRRTRAFKEGHPLIPSYRTEAEYLEDITRLGTWEAAAAEVCRREGIRPQGRIQLTSGRRYPAMFLPPAHYLKLYIEQPWSEGRDNHARERRALELIAAHDPDLPAPRLMGSGALADNLWYNLLSPIPGVPLRMVKSGLDEPTMVSIAAWAGDFLHRLHALPLEPEERTRGFDVFATRVAALVRSAVPELEQRRGLPPHLIAQVGPWLRTSEDLAGSPEEMVVAHCDFKFKHIFVEIASGGARPTGVIDFTIRYAQPMWDFCYIWGDIRHEGRPVIEAFMSAARFPGYGEPGFERRALAWALIQRWDRAYSLPDIETVTSLDELAERAFGL